MARRKAEERKVEVGNVTGVSGEVNIAAGDIYKGYTSEQVSVLLTQITSTFQPKPFDGRCPYKGLDVFEEEDAELFFGREGLVDDLVSRVKESRTVFITGPSGCGKSSLVRAGLIHALKQGVIKNSERWLYETMKPGRDPIGELARVSSRLAGSTNAEDEIRSKALGDATSFARWCEIALKEGGDKRVVLFIDQFEEVFTQINTEAERMAFLNLLTHAAIVENGRVIVLFSMRSDFVSNCATYPELNALLNQQFMQIGAMKPGELVSAIAQPALLVGLRIDPDLIAHIINDMQGEPGALPLMEFALKDLFDSQEAKGGVIALTLNDYLQRGGIHKSLERHADNAFSKLSESEQELARSIFSGVIEIGRGTQDTSRTALFDELISANTNAENVETVVQKLADARLLTTDEQAGKDTVMLSHEKLIDAWPWLRTLVNENRDLIALQNEIAVDAKEWENHKRDTSYLYRGSRLAYTYEQITTMQIIQSASVHAFINASIEAETAEHLARKRRLKKIIYISVVAGIVVIVMGFWGLTNALQRRQQEKLAHFAKIEIIALIQKNIHPDLSALLQVEAIRGLKESDPDLVNNLLSSEQLIAPPLQNHKGEVFALAFSPDGKTLASGSADQSVILWNVSDPANPLLLTQLFDHKGAVLSLAFSSDGKTLASGSADQSIILWNVSDPANPLLLTQLFDHKGAVLCLAFVPDGKILASGSADQSIILWNVSDLSKPLLLSQISGDPVSSLAISPDGSVLVSGGRGTPVEWDISNPAEPFDTSLGRIVSSNYSEFPHATAVISSLNFSPDSMILAAGSDDGMIYFYTSSASNITQRELRRLIIAGVRGDILVPIGSFSGSMGQVYSLVFNPDESVLASGSADGTVRLWKPTIYDLEVCYLAGRNFTRPEWAKYFPNEDYRATCPEWPLEQEPTPISSPIR